MLPLNKHSLPHPINVEISAPGAYSNKSQHIKNVSESNLWWCKIFKTK